MSTEVYRAIAPLVTPESDRNISYDKIGYIPGVYTHFPFLSAVLCQGLQDPSQLLPPQVHERVEDREDPSPLRLRPPIRRHRRLQGKMRHFKPLPDLHAAPAQ